MVEYLLGEGCHATSPGTAVRRVGALFIDQSNLAERSAQMRIIADIYERADYVVGWFGPDDGTKADAAGVIERLIPIMPRPNQ